MKTAPNGAVFLIHKSRHSNLWILPIAFVITLCYNVTTVRETDTTGQQAGKEDHHEVQQE